jgi:hypothetical protein
MQTHSYECSLTLPHEDPNSANPVRILWRADCVILLLPVSTCFVGPSSLCGHHTISSWLWPMEC